MKLNRENNNIWITADQHFNHDNIIKYCDRPFVDSIGMNSILIDNFNECVKPNDYVIIVGDIAFGNNKLDNMKMFLSKLNGKKIIVWGNHDKKCDIEELKKYGVFHICDYLELSTQVMVNKNYQKQKFVICHYPIFSWNGKQHDTIMLHGHCHGNLNENDFTKNNKILDIGVDTNNFMPYNIDVVYEMVRNKGNQKLDHHG